MYTNIFEFYNEEEWEEYSRALQELGYKWVSGDQLTEWNPYRESSLEDLFKGGVHLIVYDEGNRACTFGILTTSTTAYGIPIHITDFPETFKETFTDIDLEEVLAG